MTSEDPRLPWLSPAGTRHDDNITDDGRALRLEQGWTYQACGSVHTDD